MRADCITTRYDIVIGHLLPAFFRCRSTACCVCACTRLCCAHKCNIPPGTESFNSVARMDEPGDGLSTTGSKTTAQSFKVVLLGEGCVGKTSLVLRYTEDKFNDRHVSTLQASFVKKKLNLNGRRINLSIWDTAGQERFHALGPIYYRMSNGAILVYDITDEDSFQKVKNWIKELKKMLGSEICLVIAGNKIDLEKDRTVSVEDAENYASSVGAVHFHTSAKINSGIEEIFLSLCRMMIEKADKQIADNLVTLNRSGSTRRRTIIIDDEDDVPSKESSRWCCSS